MRQSPTNNFEAHSRCWHQASEKPAGLALVTVGNSLRGDDGIGQALADALPESVSRQICHFDLGPYTNLAVDCLAGHEAAIIVDSTTSDGIAGTVLILDLEPLIQAHNPGKLFSCHSFSIIDELRLAHRRRLLPKRLTFFGVEAAKSKFGEGISCQLSSKMPSLIAELTSLIERSLKELRFHA